MPIYEYQCSQCGYQLEAIQKMSDSPLRDCPSCQKPALNKLISAAGFQLKGTGWYATDFRHKGKAAVAEKSDSATSTAADSTTTTSKDEKNSSSNSTTGSTT